MMSQETAVQQVPTASEKKEIKTLVRWMVRRDMNEVLTIEQASFDFGWTEEDFLSCLRQRNCIGIVAEHVIPTPYSPEDIVREAHGLFLQKSRAHCTGQQNWFDAENNLRRKMMIAVVGFTIYELHKNQLHVLNFAVHPDFRRCGVGSTMTGKLVNKLSQQRRQEIMLKVRETNLAAQLFFKQQGFRARGVFRQYYADSNEDAYMMHYRLDGNYAHETHVPTNRISKFQDSMGESFY